MADIAGIDTLKEILAETNARRFLNQQHQFIPITGDEELRRVFPETAGRDQAPIRQFMIDYTSAKNAEVNQKLKYVDDPMVDGEIYLGRYRHAGFTMGQQRDENRKKVELLVQILRKGYLQTLLDGNGNLDFAEARLESINAAPTDGDANAGQEFVVLAWHNVAADKADDIVLAISALGSSSITISSYGEQIGTNYTRLYCASGEENDGSATIKCLFAKPRFSLTSFANWDTVKEENITYHFDVPDSIAQGLITAEKSERKTVTVAHDDQRKMCNIIVREKSATVQSIIDDITAKSEGITRTSSFYWNVDKSSAESTYDIPLPVLAGWAYTKQLTNNGDGTFSVVIHGTLRAAQSLPTYTSHDGHAIKETLESHFGRTTDPTIPGKETGTDVRVRKGPKAPDGTYPVAIVRRTPVARDDEHAASNLKNRHESTTRSFYKSDQIEDPPKTINQHAITDNQPDGFGGWNTVERTRIFEKRDGSEVEKTEGYTKETIVSDFDSDALATAIETAVLGKTINRSAMENEAGSYKNITTTRTMSHIENIVNKEFAHRYGTGYMTVVKHSTPDDFIVALGNLSGEYTNSIGVTQRVDGLIDYTIQSTPFAPPGVSTSGGWSSEISWFMTRKMFRRKTKLVDSVRKSFDEVRYIQLYLSKKYTTSNVAARSHMNKSSGEISALGSASVPPGAPSEFSAWYRHDESDVESRGEHRWLSHRIFARESKWDPDQLGDSSGVAT